MAKSAYDGSTFTRPAGEPEVFEFDVTVAADRFPLAVRWGGRELLRDEAIETSSIPFALIKFCIAGSGIYESENSRWEVHAGDVFWSGFHEPTTLTRSPGVDMTNYCIALFGKDTKRELIRFLHSPVGVLKVREPRNVQSVFELLIDEGRGNSDHRDENSSLLARVLLRRIDSLADLPLAAHALARQTFKRCRDYIESNFATATSLGTVADACEVTVPYLCRLFDNFFDCGPYEYMTRLKMKRAESLLLRPSMPIGEVATAVGYKDPRLFSRNFKVAFGKTPSKYRHSLLPPAAK